MFHFHISRADTANDKGQARRLSPLPAPICSLSTSSRKNRSHLHISSIAQQATAQ
jgi:hypothetical protein